MEREELIVQVMLKPNCGLENTRASLVVRRIAPLCLSVSCHPRTVKNDQGTIDFLRDHGLFIRFRSNMPEQVLLAIKGAFFVDRCTLVDDPDAIPPLDLLSGEEEDGGAATGASTTFTDRGERNERNDELTELLARFEEAHRTMRACVERYPHDRAFNDVMFTHAQALDGLRTAVERSRIESFDRIAPSLHTLTADYGRRFGKAVNLQVEESRVALDRSVLATMEETIKRVIRSCIRDGIEDPDVRTAAGKPARATIHLRVENAGSDIVCRIEHDGYAFDARLAGKLALERGLLTRPIESYTEEEIGSFLLLPRFGTPSTDRTGKAFSEFNEIGTTLQHIGGHGRVRNTERGTIEIALYFPVPFTVLEVALVRAGDTVFALPAQQIKRFEAFRADRVEAEHSPEEGRRDDRHGAEPARACYLAEDGDRFELLNGQADPSPLDAEQPAFVLLLDVSGMKRALAVDAVRGYERVSVNQLPPLVDRGTARTMGCIGYAVSDDGMPFVVISARRLLNVWAEGGGHA